MDFDDDFDDFDDFDGFDGWRCIACSASIPENSEFELCDDCKEHHLEEIYGDQTPCRFCGEPLGHLEFYDDFHVECWHP